MLTIRSTALLGALAALCSAQTGQMPDEVIRVPVNVVLVPTTVVDKSGEFVTGLKVEDFRLLDNDKVQEISEDSTLHPLSVVVAVQASYEMEDVLPKIQKIGSLISDLVVGETGEAAIVAFDHRIRTIQDFTADGTKISDALKKIKPGSSSSRMIDAVAESIRMLKRRPEDHHKVILLISETHDRSSEMRMREALTQAQFANVSIYTINVSQLVTQITTRQMAPAPSPIPVTATVMPPGAPVTPTSLGTIRNMGNVIPAFEDIFKAVKGVFISNAAEVFTRFTGGREYRFVKQRTLERDLARLGEELHSQYLISYHPSTIGEGGYHRIQVIVSRPDLEIRSRPGYWIAGRPQ